MAGDWIKMRADLFTHPKVVRMASALRADTLRTVGGLMSAWCLFDAHSVDGELVGYTSETLDEHLRWPGFAAAMIWVGWLSDDGQALVLPDFDTHNGASAKRRAQDADRKKAVRKTSASDADKLRTREEKRREEKEEDSQPPVGQQASACPHSEIVALYHEVLPSLAAVKVWDDTRQGMLRKRWREDPKRQSLAYWRRYFEHVSRSDFLMGRVVGQSGRPFDCTLEWLIRPTNFAKVIEGKYHAR